MYRWSEGSIVRWFISPKVHIDNTNLNRTTNPNINTNPNPNQNLKLTPNPNPNLKDDGKIGWTNEPLDYRHITDVAVHPYCMHDF